MGNVLPLRQPERPQSDFTGVGGVLKKYRFKKPADIVCPTCGEETWTKTNDMEHPRPCACVRKVAEEHDAQMRVYAEQERRYELKRRVEDIYSLSGMGQRLRDMTFDSFHRERMSIPFDRCKKYAETFPDRLKDGRGFILCGTSGTGKTHLVTATANFIVKNHQSVVVYRTEIDLFESLQKSFDGGTDPIPLLISADLLIIDDLGTKKRTEWVGEKLFQIINGRYNDYKPVLITTMKPLPELERYVGEACFSRLREICRGAVIDMVGSDYRKKGV